jgi:septum formation protein
MTGSAHAPFILASASPRRAELLDALGIGHRVVPAELDETRRPGEAPEAYVERLAREKAESVRTRNPGAWVLAGDTTVALGDEILEKPEDAADAVRMLLVLSGREHRVATGLALAAPAPAGAGKGARAPTVLVSGVEVTRVRFRPFGEDEARAYVATGEPMDKAGAYGIQGLGGTLVEGIEGDFSGVVGLSVPLLVRLLDRAGRPYAFPAPTRGRQEGPALSEAATLAHLLARELAAARREVLAYPDDETPWRTLPGWPNTGGTLALHLAGNLRHFVGAVLGGDGYVRDREAEFGRRGASRAELAAALAAAEGAVLAVLPALDPPALDAPAPVNPPAWEGRPQPTLRAFLLHLLSHAAYHLGQLDYHRRAVTGDEAGVGAIGLGELP